MAVLFSQRPYGLTVTDIDGNIYRTVTIGRQVWMRENLKVTRYCNGDTIATIKPDTIDLTNIQSPSYQWAYMGDERNVAVNGRLYTWFVVDDRRQLCPKGWHIPSDEEFCVLENYIEPDADTDCKKTGHRGRNTGGMLKEAGLSHWTEPNSGADNRSRFTGLPCGVRYQAGVFTFLGSYGYFWTNTSRDSTMAWTRRLYHDKADVSRACYFKKDSFSVRCLKD
ncbi:MAG: fibrobacter succinogenes major paralogous domain-containing protein [Bacteroidales bacterium]